MIQTIKQATEAIIFSQLWRNFESLYIVVVILGFKQFVKGGDFDCSQITCIVFPFSCYSPAFPWVLARGGGMAFSFWSFC